MYKSDAYIPSPLEQNFDFLLILTGFSNTLVACCGGGGPYNFNNSARCGHIGSKSCLDASSFTNWDGIHLTEAAYHHIAKGLLNGPFTSPSLTFPPIKQI